MQISQFLRLHIPGGEVEIVLSHNYIKILLNNFFFLSVTTVLSLVGVSGVQDKSDSSRKDSQDYFQLEGENAQRQFCTLHAIQLACFGNHYAGQDN